MRCVICNKPFFHNISFKNLFYFNFICPLCSEYRKPKLLSIPIDDGYLLNYYYFTDDSSIEEKLLMRLFDEIRKIIFENKNTLILFDDEDSLTFLKYLNFDMNITLIGIAYQDLEYLLFDDSEQ